MKNILVICMVLFSTSLFGQDTLKLEDLTTKNKRELTEIYLNEVVNLICALPATSLNPNDIPSSSYLAKQFRAITKSSEKNADVIIKRYKSIIPYSNREDLIDSIMFLNEMKLQMNSIN